MKTLNLASDKQRFLDRFAFWSLLTVVTTGIFLPYVGLGYVTGLWRSEPGLTLDAFIRGTANKPFVFRALVPLLMRVGTAIIPYDPKIYASLAMYLSLLGFIIAFRYLIHYFWSPSPATDVWTLFSLPALAPLMLINGHIYDLPTLFLFTLELAFLVRGRFWPFLLVYPVACLNKETTILLTAIFVVCWYHRTQRRQFIALLIAQVATYGLIRLVLMWMFRDNAGGMVEYHLPDQIYFVLNAPVIEAIYGLFAIGVFALMLHDTAHKPWELKLAALVTLPPLAILYFIFGGPLEIRVFYEAFPIVYTLAIPTLSKLMKLKIEPGVVPRPARRQAN